MIITVGGSIGSGKSTLARMLAEKCGFKYLSVGSIMRSMAEERGLSLLEMGRLAETDPSIDKELDKRQKELCATSCDAGCVMDSRLGAYLLDADFKIWLDVSPDIQAKRIAGRDGLTPAEAREQIKKRRESERVRYKGIYGIDLEDLSVYDFVLDTTRLTKAQMLDECVKAVKIRAPGICRNAC